MGSVWVGDASVALLLFVETFPLCTTKIIQTKQVSPLFLLLFVCGCFGFFLQQHQR